MKDFGKKIFGIIIGMLIATFLIFILLWFINRSMLKHNFSAEKKSSTPISVTQPETLNPIDLNKGVKSHDISDNQTEPSITTSPFDTSDYENSSNSEEEDPEATVAPEPTVASNNDSYNSNIKEIPTRVTPNTLKKTTPTPVTKKINSAKKTNDDVIGNLINNINNGKANPQRTKSTTTNTTNAKTYKVQMGSYKSQQEAEKQKARLIMLDIPSQVITANINGQNYYRVVTARPISKVEANQIKSKLKSKNLDSLIISQ